MKFFMRLIVLLALALAVAGFSKFNSGNVSFYFADYRIDLALNLLIVLWLLSFGLFYYFIRLYINLNRLPNKIRRARVKNALILSRRYLNSAGLHYFEGKYRSCYNDALKSVSKEFSHDNKFLAYLLAFRAASVMRDEEKEDKILAELAEFKEAKWQLAKHMLIAENRYNQQQYGQAIDNLSSVLSLDHKHIPARRLLLKVYLHLGNYHKAYEMLTWLLKNDSLREYKASKYKARVISGLFAEVNELTELKHIFNKLTKAEKSSFIYAKTYFNALVRLHEFGLALGLLEQQFKDETLSLSYSDSILVLAKQQLSVALVDRLLKVAESCLNAQRNSHELLLAVGILCVQRQLWGKAQAYLEASINLKPATEGYLYLAKVAEANHDQQLLAQCQSKLLAASAL